MKFERFIGIDYSGAETPTSRIKGLQVYMSVPNGDPRPVRPAPPAKNWTRQEVAHWLLAELQRGEPLLIGIDHGFSFPMSYFDPPLTLPERRPHCGGVESICTRAGCGAGRPHHARPDT